MKGLTKEFISLTLILVLAFLVLTNSTGFARSIGALGGSYVRIIRAFQGRG